MGLIVDAEEGARMLKEVGTFAAYGLIENDPDIKQFFFERILLSLGMSIAHPRESMGATVGKAPTYLDQVNTSLEKIK